MNKSEIVSVIHLPEKCSYNTFIDRTQSIQSKKGIKILKPNCCIDDKELKHVMLNPEILNEVLKNNDKCILHFHWAEKIYRNMEKDLFIRTIEYAKRRGIKIIRTIHNLAPHEMFMERNSPENEIEEILDNATDKFIVFSEKQRDILIKKKKGVIGKVEVISHPKYSKISNKYFEIEKNRESARKKLRLNQKEIIILSLGRIREYKNYKLLISSMSLVNSSKITMLVVGNPDSLDIVNEIKVMAKNDKRIKIETKFVDEFELQLLMASADVIALAHNHIWSSGLAVLAADYSKPILGLMPLMFDIDDNMLSQVGFIIKAEEFNKLKFSQLIEKVSAMSHEEIARYGINFNSQVGNVSDDEIGNKYQNIYNNLFI